MTTATIMVIVKYSNHLNYGQCQCEHTCKYVLAYTSHSVVESHANIFCLIIYSYRTRLLLPYTSQSIRSYVLRQATFVTVRISLYLSVHTLLRIASFTPRKPSKFLEPLSPYARTHYVIMDRLYQGSTPLSVHTLVRITSSKSRNP